MKYYKYFQIKHYLKICGWDFSHTYNNHEKWIERNGEDYIMIPVYEGGMIPEIKINYIVEATGDTIDKFKAIISVIN